MSKIKLKRIITLVYSAAITALFCLASYLISLRISFDLKETFFLIGLVFVLVGIVILLTRNQNRTVLNYETEAKKESIDDQEDNINFFLLGFNSYTPVLTGVFLLIVDAVIK